MSNLGQKRLEALESLLGLFVRFKSCMQQALSEHGESVPPPMVLRLLQLCSQQPGITPSGLVGATGRDKAQITRMVKVLLDEGLLERQAHPEDKRSHCLWPTKRGQGMVKVFQRAQERVAAEMFSSFNEHELQLLMQQWQLLGGCKAVH